MSDLASFVAATIRDRVVHDQQTEIDSLRHQVRTLQDEAQTMQRTIKERDFMRTVRLKMGGGSSSISIANVLDASVVDEDNGADLFPTEDDVLVTVQDMAEAEVYVDGRLATRLCDMAVTSKYLKMCLYTRDMYMCVRLDSIEDDHAAHAADIGGGPAGVRPDLEFMQQQQQQQQRTTGLTFHVFVGPLSAADYCSIVRIPVDRFPKIDLATAVVMDIAIGSDEQTNSDAAGHTGDGADGHKPCTVVDATRRRCTFHDLLRVAAGKDARFCFEDGSCYCSGEYFFDHLDVPYVP